MGILRRFREWRERTDGTLEGPSLTINNADLTITEDGGDWVAKDGNGNVVLRYDEASGSWVMDSLSTEKILSGPIFAGNKDGSTPDDRLDNAISDANPRDTIRLENDTYTANRSISKELQFVGGSANFNGTNVEAADWTLDERCAIIRVSFIINSSIKVNGQYTHIGSSAIDLNDAPITVNANNFRYIGNVGGQITFDSSTNRGIVDGCSDTTVTDNGSNTVGDIA
jgi:hypothetical protein